MNQGLFFFSLSLMDHLIVGLGNPGQKYSENRHNIGFMACDLLAQSTRWKTESQALVAQVLLGEFKVLLVKPQTYMNLSGTPTQNLLHFYKIPLSNLLVIHDDIDQPYGGLRFHKNRGSGGHNGIKDITEKLGTMDYTRLKLGVGRPTVPGPSVADYVLQDFNFEEKNQLPSFLNKASDATLMLFQKGLVAASTIYNK